MNFQNIKENMIVDDAIVKATTDWGIFLDINGIEGECEDKFRFGFSLYNFSKSELLTKCRVCYAYTMCNDVENV